MHVVLLTNYLPPYRLPLYERLARQIDLEVLCFGGGERYVPPWFADLDAQLAGAPFPARRVRGLREVFGAARGRSAVIAPFAGGAMLPVAFAGTRAWRRPFILWASVWAQPRSAAHLAARPLARRIYRDAEAVVAYGEHVRDFVAGIRGRTDDVFVAPQAVEASLFGRFVESGEVERFRASHGIPPGPVVLYVGRLVPEKGVGVLLAAWQALAHPATLVLIGDGPLAAEAAGLRSARVLGALPREELPVAYATATATVLASIPTPRFREPWGLVCNESLHQGTPVVASDAVGAVAGGLVRDGESGLVVPAGDAGALAGAIERLIADRRLRGLLGTAGHAAVAAFNYDEMALAFQRAVEAAGAR